MANQGKAGLKTLTRLVLAALMAGAVAAAAAQSRAQLAAAPAPAASADTETLPFECTQAP